VPSEDPARLFFSNSNRVLADALDLILVRPLPPFFLPCVAPHEWGRPLLPRIQLSCLASVLPSGKKRPFSWRMWLLVPPFSPFDAEFFQGVEFFPWVSLVKKLDRRRHCEHIHIVLSFPRKLVLDPVGRDFFLCRRGTPVWNNYSLGIFFPDFLLLEFPPGEMVCASGLFFGSLSPLFDSSGQRPCSLFFSSGFFVSFLYRVSAPESVIFFFRSVFSISFSSAVS